MSASEDYFNKHLFKLAEVVQDQTSAKGEKERIPSWQICCSEEGACPLPNGDPNYTGTGPKVYWDYANPLFLIPLSKEARAAAEKAYRNQLTQQQGDLDFPSDSGVAEFIAMDFWSERRADAGAEAERSILLGEGCRLSALKGGQWFRLFPSVDEHFVWISTTAKRDIGVISWQLPASHVGRVEAVSDIVAELGLHGRSGGTNGNDDVYISVAREGIAATTRVPVRWKGTDSGFDLDWRGETVPLDANGQLIAGSHRLEWRGAKTQFSATYTRSFTINTGGVQREDSLVRVLDLTSDVDVSVLQRYEEKDGKNIVRLFASNAKKPPSDLPLFQFRLPIIWNQRLVASIARSLYQVRRGAQVSAAPRIDRQLESVANGINTTSAVGPGVGWLQSFVVERGDGGEWNFVLHKDVGIAVKDALQEFQSDLFAGKQSFPATLTWPALRTVAGPFDDGLQLNGCEIWTRQGLTIDVETEPDDGTLFEFFVNLAKIPQTQSGQTLRDGALDLDVGGSAAVAKLAHFGRLRALLHLVQEQQPFFLFQWSDALADKPMQLSYSIEELILPLLNVRAAGEDPRPEDEYIAAAGTGAIVQGNGERSDPPLVFSLPPIGKRDPGPDAKYLLIANESINVAQSLRLDLRIDALPSASTSDGNDFRVVVLDSAPQLAAQVSSQFARRTQRDTGTTTIARRSPLSEEQNGWEIFDENALTDGFELRLSAQDLGEQAVKGKTDFPEGKIAQSRFGPPAVLRVAPERLDRGFVAVPWNLRRIFIERGSPSPGVPLIEAYFELLYALGAHLKRSDLLLSEIGSKLGDLPTPALAKSEWRMTHEQRDAFSQSWRQFLQAYRAWNTRLALLEVSDSNAPLKPVNVTDGVDYRARIQVETDQQTKITSWKNGASIDWPLAVAIPNELKPFHGDADHPGLRGGAFWGFESLEIYKEFWGNLNYQKSSSGEIADLAFSSIGGFGKQTARFAHDKTAILSNTAAGRTHVYAVERIGRIGVFWNKAKHVILYERTTAPSPQMSDPGNPDQQPEHLRRPLLRKVREYVEILEPERQYPDFPGHDDSSPGAVKASVFRTRIFPVLSSWGQTVYLQKIDDKTGKITGEKPIGWEVPLWKEGAKPEIYPKPQVLLHLTPPQDADVDFVAVTLEEPQVLRFYTDTRDKDPDSGKFLTADVHVWPVVEGVDFTNQPEPATPNVSPSGSEQAADLDLPLPGAVVVPPGFERFTFRVAPTEFPADVAGRYFADARISGKLRSVTMMRCEPSEPSTNTQSTDWWNWKPTDYDPGHPDLKDPCGALHALISDDKESVGSRAQNGFPDITAQVKRNQVDPAKLKLETFRDKAKSWFNGAQSKLTGLRDKLERPPAANNRFLLLWTQLKSVVASSNPNWKIQTLPGKALWREVLEGADGIVTRVMSLYDDVARKFNADISAISGATSNASDQVKAAIDRLKDSLTGFSTALEWTVAVPFELAKTQLNLLADRTVAAIDSSFKANLLDKLDQLSGNLAAAITTLRGWIDAARDNSVRKIVDPFKARIASSWPNLAATITDLEEAINDLHKDLTDLCNAATNLEQLVSDVRARLQRGVGELEAQAAAACKVINDYVGPQLDQARDMLAKPFGDIQGFIKTGTTNLAVARGEFDAVGANVQALLARFQANIAGSFRTELETTLVGLTAMPHGGVAKLLVGAAWVSGQPPDTVSVYHAVLVLDQALREAAKYAESILPDIALKGADAAFDEFFKTMDEAVDLERAIKSGKPGDIIDASEKLANHLNGEIGKMAGDVAALARDGMATAGAAKAAVQAGKNVLRNARSVWDEFTAPGLGFNRRTIAMVVNFKPQNIEERLGLTPCMARVKELGDKLEGLGLRFPTVGLGHRLLPAVKERFKDLTQSFIDRFDFSHLMSDVGGMRLTKLLPGLKMPQWAEDKIKITHGFDKEKLKAWVNATSDVQFTDRKTLMNFGPLLVALDKGRFTGTVRIEADVEGKTNKVARGSLVGDWTLEFGGTAFMIYHDVAIRFEGGKLDFDLNPKRMESPGLLKLLTDATEAIPGEDNGFKFGVVKEAEMPVGVRADLELGPFGASGGVSGITNLLFGGFFELRFFEPPATFAFSVASGFHVGRQDSPFDLQVFILGGGGYLDASFFYQPQHDILAVDVALAVHASASLRINVGWMQGGVAIYLGLEAEYHKPRSRRSPAFYASFFVMVEGYVSIIGLITVNLMLRLACTFKSLPGGGTEFAGSGTVSVTIKISCFFKITVHRTYTRVIARSGGGNAQVQAAHLADLIAAADVQARALGQDNAIEHPIHIGRAFRDIITANNDPILNPFRQACDAHIDMLAPA